MPDTLPIRLASAADFDPIGQLIFDAIHTANDAYTLAERQAWMPEPPQGLAWAARLATQDIWVAEVDAKRVGVITLAQDGYIDLAYILADQRGSGLFKRLYETLETHARSAGEARLWSHASLTATPAFEKQGFRVIKPDPVEKDGQTLRRFEMEKWLDERNTANG